MMNQRNGKKKYLVYQLGQCEMGSGGRSNYYYYAVAEGDTEEEIMKSWAENVKLLYGVELNPKKRDDGKWEDYYLVVFNELLSSVSGGATKLCITRTDDNGFN